MKGVHMTYAVWAVIWLLVFLKWGRGSVLDKAIRRCFAEWKR